MADVNEVIGGYKLRTPAADRADVAGVRGGGADQHRHFAMKLLLPEAAANARPPASAVPRGRGRASS